MGEGNVGECWCKIIILCAIFYAGFKVLCCSKFHNQSYNCNTIMNAIDSLMVISNRTQVYSSADFDQWQPSCFQYMEYVVVGGIIVSINPNTSP